MCGIIGFVGKEQAAPMLLNSIKRLEYRGYDSVGMATLHDGAFTIKKDVGEYYQGPVVIAKDLMSIKI